MNYLPEYLSPALVEALGWTILHSLWQGTLVATLLSVLMILLHRYSAKLRYGVATGALALVLLLAVFTFFRIYEPIPAKIAITQQHTQEAKYHTTEVIISNSQAEASTTTPGLLTSFETYFNRNLPVVVLVWLLGLVVMLLKFLGGLAYTQRLKSYQTMPVSAEWEQKVLTLAQKLQVTRPVRLVQSYLVKTPLVIGFLKPAILLPVGTLAGLSANQIEAILAHELAHISRKDYLLNLGQALIEIIFFYHPAVWWISDYVRIEREHCCDDQAIAICGDPLVYARALAHLETLAFKTPAPELTLAFAGKDGSLLGRIKRLVQKQGLAPTFTEGFLAAFVIATGFTVVSVSAFAGFTSPNMPLKTLPVKISDTAVAKILNSPVIPTEDGSSKASIYSYQDSIGKKSDLVIIKNKKGEITELFVNGKKIPQADIKDFSQVIEEAVAATKNAPRLKSAEKTAQLNKTKEALSKLEKDFEYNSKENKDFNYNFNLDLNTDLAGVNFENFKMPAIPPIPDINIFPPLPPTPPMPPFPAMVPQKPLEYLKQKNISDKAVYIINGKKLTGSAGKKAAEKLSNTSIVLLEIFGPEKAFDRYGEEGKNGVVVLKTAKGNQNKVTIHDYTGQDGNEENEWIWHQNNLQAQLNENRLEQQQQRLRQITAERQKIEERRMEQHNIRMKEHEARMKDHAERMKDHEVRMKEHEKRMARLEVVKKQLIADKLINADDKEFSFRISNEGLYINDKKQPEEVYQKYLKLYFPEGEKPTGTFNETYRIN